MSLSVSILIKGNNNFILLQLVHMRLFVSTRGGKVEGTTGRPEVGEEQYEK
jgi:hypothetical protein